MSGPPDRTGQTLTGRARRIAGDPAIMPRAAIFVGIGATIAMNITGGLRDSVGASVLGALIPIGFVIGLETIIVLIRRCTLPWWGIAAASLPLFALAAITGWVSWLHGYQVAVWTDNPRPISQLIPFIPDLMILCGSIVLVALKVATKTTAQRTTDRTTVQRTTVQRTKRTKQPSARTKATAARAAEKDRIVKLVRSLAAVPSERAIAADYCGGSRRLARKVLAELATASNGTGGNH